jgi:DNA-binding NarL/FixJ family response regulator
MANQTINVHVCHCEPAMNAGLLAILAACKDFVITVDADGMDCRKSAQVVIADYATGLFLTRGMKSAPAILIVSYLDKEWEVRTAVQSGAKGYLHQSATAEELTVAVRQVASGKAYLGDSISRSAMQSQNRVMLTGRESDVLQLLAEGCCNKLIARRLGIGLGTVKSHVKGVMSKLDATARTHAVVVAAARGLVNPGRLAPNPTHDDVMHSV